MMADDQGNGAGNGTGGGSAGGASGAAGGGDAGAGAAGAGGAAGPTVAELQAQLAALQAKDAEREAASTKASDEAAQKAEAERVAKLSETQKLQEAFAKQQADIDATKAQLVAERRALALEKLGVVEKFRAYAPAVDPADPKGAKALEEWAKANPELVAPVRRDITQSPLDALKTAAGTALQQVLAGTRKSTLVTERNLSKLK